MRKIKHYAGNSYLFHKKVLSAKRNASIIKTVESMDGSIKKAFEEYDKSFYSDTLHYMHPLSLDPNQQEALRALYSYRLKPFQELLAELTTDEYGRVAKLCPNCTINEIHSLDHCVPKGEFPEFSDHPRNLMQCCPVCNSKKSEIWRDDANRTFLNLFIDDIPDVQYLFINSRLVKNIPFFLFSLSRPQGIEDVMFERIEGHYNSLDLLKRFSETSSYIIDELKFTIKSSSESGCTNDMIKKTILNNAGLLQSKFGINYWKALIYKEVGENELIFNALLGSKG